MAISQLIRFLYPYGSERRVLRGPARGMRCVVEPGIGFAYAIAMDDAAPRHFQEKIRPGMTVYDVGANKGQMALIFSALVGPSGRVLALEPAPAEYASLERNVRLNGLENVRTIEAAAADAAGRLSFMYAAELPTQGKLADVEPTYTIDRAETLMIDALTLDDLLAEESPPDIVKIDVEGAATSVLRGARNVLEDIGPAVYVELHGPEEQAGIRDELLARGYIARTMAGEAVEDPTSGWYSPLWCCKPAPPRSL